ncbi:MAG: SusD/RagB family nutrient-binding outer membrane lipoprotein [Prevotellaceae bacterium]|nr:SusD/RagB family nutrient-binding outer membrane lipoprotein [Prevotellaceae bacterium]
MKNIKYFGLGLLMVFALFACNDFLDVNVNPDSPTNAVASIEARLPVVQHATISLYGLSAHFSSLMTQHTTVSQRGNNRQGGPAQWEFTGAQPIRVGTYPYQMFFVYAGANFDDLYNKAEEEGAYHYMATVKFFRAVGFMVMLDYFGEIPYTEAFSPTLNPPFDDGKTIFYGCLAELQEAIDLFKKTQEPGAVPLAAGDSWNGGDVGKWIKMCYGFKARWLNNLSKKTDGQYKPDEILAALELAPKNNNESTIIRHEDVDGTITGSSNYFWADPFKVSIEYIWSFNWGHNPYLTKWYTEMLTNFDGQGIIDPRAYKLIPMIQNGTNFELSDGVDMRTDVRVKDSLQDATYNATTKTWKRNAYGTFVGLRTRGTANPTFEEVASDGTYLTTGAFYSRADAPTHFMCYPEMCFIKAEVLFRQGQTGPAFEAYKEGIKVHLDLMNERLSTYSDATNPSKQSITQADIDNYLNTAIGTANNLTLGKIMQQKYIALGFSLQNWNDLRRLDYSSQVYPGWEPPYEWKNGYSSQVSIPAGKLLRRARQCVHEYSYNNDNVGVSHPHALMEDIWSYPVWWDYPTDDYKQ